MINNQFYKYNFHVISQKGNEVVAAAEVAKTTKNANDSNPVICLLHCKITPQKLHIAVRSKDQRLPMAVAATIKHNLINK